MLNLKNYPSWNGEWNYDTSEWSIDVVYNFLTTWELIQGVWENNPYFKEPELDKSILIESIFMNTFLFPILIDNSSSAISDKKFIVYSNIQTLLNIKDFIENKFSLENLKFLTELNGFYFSDLEPKFQRCFLRETLLFKKIIFNKKD